MITRYQPNLGTIPITGLLIAAAKQSPVHTGSSVDTLPRRVIHTNTDLLNKHTSTALRTEGSGLYMSGKDHKVNGGSKDRDEIYSYKKDCSYFSDNSRP